MKLKPKNPYVIPAKKRKAGRHRDKKKERNRKACRKRTSPNAREEN